MKTLDEQKHAPAGSSKGGQFVSSGGGSDSSPKKAESGKKEATKKEGAAKPAATPAHQAAAASPGFEKVAEGDVYRVRQLLAQTRLYGDQMKPKEFGRVQKELAEKGYTGKIQVGSDTVTKIRESSY